LFTQSIPLVTGTTDKQTPEALRLAANSSGSLAIFAAIRRASLRAATALKAEQQLRQLRHIDGNPPRLGKFPTGDFQENLGLGTEICALPC
jgi:hypothetical protein